MIPALKNRWVRSGLALLVMALIGLASFVRDRVVGQSLKVADIVLMATVTDLNIVSADRSIDVASDTVAVGVDHWIVSFKVDSVVAGEFPSEEVNVLVHSPAEFGVEGRGDRFKLQLCRRTAEIRSIASTNQALSDGPAQLVFSKRTYKLLASDRRP